MDEFVPFGSVLTLPATGSEWNNAFVVSRRSIGWKLGVGVFNSYPVFSLLDPRYTMTLPVRQIRNGIFDAFTHCVDCFLTPIETPLFDDFFIAVCRELVDIGVPLIQPNSSLELHGRLIIAASFACNKLFALAQEPCWGIHNIAHMLTAKYGIDHGVTLAMVMPHFYESQFEQRKIQYAKMAEKVFGICDGNVDEKAHAFIASIKKWIHDLGLQEKVSQWEGAKISPGDIDELTNNVIAQSGNGKPCGFRGCLTKDVIHKILEKVII